MFLKVKGKCTAIQRHRVLEIGAGGKLEEQFGTEEIGSLSGAWTLKERWIRKYRQEARRWEWGSDNWW